MATQHTSSRGKLGALVLTLGPLACEGDPPAPPARESLVELEAWEHVEDAAQDVFGAERPAGLVCDPVLGIGTELLGMDEVLEINTDYCDYATVRQPALAGLVAGDAVEIRMWHYDLTAPAPAQAHLALAIDGEIAWEEHVSSPRAAAMLESDIVLDRDLPVGAQLQLHVHNHGANTYALISIEGVRDGAERSPRP